VEITPGIWRKVASTPQKHPAANVAFCMYRSLDQFVGWRIANCPLFGWRNARKVAWRPVWTGKWRNRAIDATL